MKHGTTVQSVNTEQFEQIKIPIPPIETQKSIEKIFKSTYQTKNDKQTQAIQILNKIDEYLLEKLSITPPTAKTDLKSRIFYTNACITSGNRLDPKNYLTFYDSLKANIRNGQYPSVSLRSLVTHSMSGDWGKDESEAAENPKYEKCLVIRATEFDNRYNFNLDGSRAKFRMILKAKLKNMSLQAGDLLIEKSGGSDNQPVGRIGIIEPKMLSEYTLGFSNFVHKIRVDNIKIDSEYLFCYLKTIHNIKLTDVMQSQTNGIRNLIMSEYLGQQIPLPPLSIQQDIAKAIREMRTQAKELQISVSEQMEQTKQDIERMIMGKTSA